MNKSYEESDKVLNELVHDDFEKLGVGRKLVDLKPEELDTLKKDLDFLGIKETQLYNENNENVIVVPSFDEEEYKKSA